MKTQSANECIADNVVRFPNAKSRHETKKIDRVSREDRAIEVHELCQSTTQAMGELRQGIENTIYEALDMMDFDARPLQFLTKETPRIVRALMRKEVDGIRTERLIEILEAMHPAAQS